ncbi:glycoside hydrolase family 5 protein [Desarmillaria ectypa]|nr:glycoside hydrolase family 5 protein [Desarmillaria ectypa]
MSSPAANLNTREHDLDPPRASFLDTRDSTGQNSLTSSPNNSAPLLQNTKYENDTYSDSERNTPSKRRGLAFWLICAAALVIVVLAVILPVYFTVIKPKHNNKDSSQSSTSGDNSSSAPETPQGNGTTNPQSPTGAITGGDGSIVALADGSSFIYNNSFGGYWVADPNDPFSGAARPNSWTPPLNQSWKFGQDHVFGVNLGGWLVLEPFITPALYEKYDGAIDEWTLSTLMAADTAGGGLQQLEDHYNTFITEKDFAEIAGAGLNWVRLPIPFWAVETWEGEPFLPKTAWKYALKAFEWARKYGLRVNLDLHTIPGSQNGYNHSGKSGQINFLYGVMGYANAQRTLNYIRIITEFISQPQYKDVVVMFGVINEAIVSSIGRDQITSFYHEVHDMMRGITGLGAGNGPFISIHDGFAGAANWADFLPGSDRIALDIHPYLAFSGGPAAEPFVTGTGNQAGGTWPSQVCQWGQWMNTSQTAFGVTMAGEFSNGWNDCGYFLNGVTGVPTFGGDCNTWQDSSKWDDATKAAVSNFAMASMDALQNWFFWTWKIGVSTRLGMVGSPLWSYQLGLENGWMPKDPRTAFGRCDAIGGAPNVPFDGTYQSWMTGGAGAGTISATVPWPPASLNGADAAVTLLPSYTSTGSVSTLSPPTLTAKATRSADVGNGWYDASDTGAAPTPIAGCTYPNAWDANNVAIPAVCGGGGAAAAPAPAPAAATATATRTTATTSIAAVAADVTDVVGRDIIDGSR